MGKVADQASSSRIGYSAAWTCDDWRGRFYRA